LYKFKLHFSYMTLSNNDWRCMHLLYECWTDPPENCHLNVKKLPKTFFWQKLSFFSTKLPESQCWTKWWDSGVTNICMRWTLWRLDPFYINLTVFPNLHSRVHFCDFMGQVFYIYLLKNHKTCKGPHIDYYFLRL